MVSRNYFSKSLIPLTLSYRNLIALFFKVTIMTNDEGGFTDSEDLYDDDDKF